MFRHSFNGGFMRKQTFYSQVMAMAACAVLMACEQTQAADSKPKVQFGAAKPPESLVTDKNIQDFRYAVADLADQIIPVVVSIRTEALVQSARAVDPFEQFFFGFQGQAPQEESLQEGLGSGVIVSQEGHILTNNHVVEKADNIVVTLADKQQYKAKVVGTDPQTDLAVLKLEEKPKEALPVAYLGNSQQLRVGEWVVAVGNPYGLSQTVTTGIVSAKGVHNRGITSYENFIQTDAAINPGNSGGALFNMKGELVGINTAILSRSGGFQGIGFAIPVDLAKIVMTDLVENGKVSRGWLGVSIQDMDPTLAKALKLEKVGGALINEVFEDSPAQKGGLKPGDVVLSLRGEAIADANALRHRVAMLRPGEKVEFEVLREGKKQKLTVTVSRREEGVTAGLMPGEEAGDGSLEPLGLSVSPLQEGQRQAAKLDKALGGVVVSGVKRGTPAGRSGLKEGDILLQLNQQRIADVAGLRKLLQAQPKNAPLLFLIRRGGGQFYAVIER